MWWRPGETSLAAAALPAASAPARAIRTPVCAARYPGFCRRIGSGINTVRIRRGRQPNPQPHSTSARDSQAHAGRRSADQKPRITSPKVTLARFQCLQARLQPLAEASHGTWRGIGLGAAPAWTRASNLASVQTAIRERRPAKGSPLPRPLARSSRQGPALSRSGPPYRGARSMVGHLPDHWGPAPAIARLAHLDLGRRPLLPGRTASRGIPADSGLESSQPYRDGSAGSGG